MSMVHWWGKRRGRSLGSAGPFVGASPRTPGILSCSLGEV